MYNLFISELYRLFRIKSTYIWIGFITVVFFLSFSDDGTFLFVNVESITEMETALPRLITHQQRVLDALAMLLLTLPFILLSITQDVKMLVTKNTLSSGIARHTFLLTKVVLGWLCLLFAFLILMLFAIIYASELFQPSHPLSLFQSNILIRILAMILCLGAIMTLLICTIYASSQRTIPAILALFLPILSAIPLTNEQFQQFIPYVPFAMFIDANVYTLPTQYFYNYCYFAIIASIGSFYIFYTCFKNKHIS